MWYLANYYTTMVWSSGSGAALRIHEVKNVPGSDRAMAGIIQPTQLSILSRRSVSEYSDKIRRNQP